MPETTPQPAIWTVDHDTYATEHVLVTVTVAGSTRTVEASHLLGGKGHFTTAALFTARIGRGAKTHQTNMAIAEVDGPGRDAVEIAGRWFRPSSRACVLNRQATITGWVEDAAATSRHIMEPANR